MEKAMSAITIKKRILIISGVSAIVGFIFGLLV